MHLAVTIRQAYGGMFGCGHVRYSLEGSQSKRPFCCDPAQRLLGDGRMYLWLITPRATQVDCREIPDPPLRKARGWWRAQRARHMVALRRSNWRYLIWISEVNLRPFVSGLSISATTATIAPIIVP
jgi:hypothetical protein